MDYVIERLLDGEILLVRGLPRAGKSMICAAIAEAVGESAYAVSGSHVDEANQSGVRERIGSEIEQRVGAHGCAQLIFDDYAQAIRRSQGGRLHSFLYGLLVDGPNARDIGALLTSRHGDDLELRFAGSPLLSRAQVLPLPDSGEQDAASLGIDLRTLRSLAGSSTAFARRIIRGATGPSIFGLAEYLRADRARLMADLPPEVVEVLLGARTADELSAAAMSVLLMFGEINDDRVFRPSRAVTESRFIDNLSTASPGWPGDRDDSLDRFAILLSGVDEALWVDRYLFARPIELGSFLQDLRTRTKSRLRLLGGHDSDSPDLVSRVRAAIGGIEGVEARTMARVDRPQLHDRHLIFSALRTGFVLPTAGVVTGCHRPGTAVAVRMPGLAANYEDYWRRGQPILPPIGTKD
jgi:hypothetical protein